MTGTLLGKLVIVIAAITVFYAWIMPRVGRISEYVARRTTLARRYGWSTINDATKLTVAAMSQLVFLGCFAAMVGVDLRDGLHLNVLLIAAGVLLGVAEMGISAFLAHFAIRLSMAIRPSAGPRRVEDWLVVARGGWMREYHNAIRVLPLGLAIALTVAYVSVEEMIFRTVIISYLGVHGSIVAVVAAAATFTLVQVLHTPGWKTAMFPVIGALVVGPVHGALFVATGDIVPLIAAHAAFFLVAVL